MKKSTPKKAAKAKPKAGTSPVRGTSTLLTVDGVLTQLESLGNDRVRAHNTKNGAGENQFGVKLGDIRVLANAIRTNHELALSLWNTGNVEAQLLATLLIRPDDLSADELERMVVSVTYVQVADWLHSCVVKEHADKESLRRKWMTSDAPMAARRHSLPSGSTQSSVVKAEYLYDLRKGNTAQGSSIPGRRSLTNCRISSRTRR